MRGGDGGDGGDGGYVGACVGGRVGACGGERVHVGGCVRLCRWSLAAMLLVVVSGGTMVVGVLEGVAGAEQVT